MALVGHHRGDYESMSKELMESNWAVQVATLANSNHSMDELWYEIKSKLNYLRDKFVPKIKSSNKPHWSNKGSVPLDEKTRAALKEKVKLFKKWIKASSEDEKKAARTQFVRARNKAKSMIRSAKKSYEQYIANNIKSNAKPFWAYTRRKMNTKTSVAALLQDVNDSSSLKFNAKEKAEILQKQFLSMFTNEQDGDFPLVTQASASISNLVLAVDEVKDMLLKINVNKSIGPDGLHPMLLKELAECLAEPITALFNSSLEKGILPDDWKIGRIIPIYKKGPKKIAENYRPISLTSILCKILEKCVRSHLMKHLVDNTLLSPKQFGFISGRSTTTQLLYFIDKCIDSISAGNVVDTIYFDFAKAFDSVPHRRLLHKLKSFGVCGNIYKWIEGFLLNRKQYVSVDGVSSDVADVLSGVPQGTVLGPILFVIYINDLLDGIKSDGVLYADDTKIFNTITSKNDAVDLQSDITKLEKWADEWMMKFHPGKCHVLTLGKFEDIKHAHQYKVTNHDIEHVDVEKDLGIIIDEEMTFEEHICTKVRIANALVGNIRRAFTFLDGQVLKKLYTSLVRPHLEYGQAIWSPFLMKYIDKIERVQERATKLINGYGNLSYTERLKLLDLPTLRFRRLRGDLIEMYKHFYTYDKNALTGPSFNVRQRSSRKHKHQVNEAFLARRRGLRENSFYGRVARAWNSLPRDVAESKDINTFKNNLDRYLDNHPMKWNHRWRDEEI